MNITNQVIILSAEQNGNSFEKNRQLTENLAGCLEDLNLSFKRAVGRYNGNDEDSFVVLVKNQVEIDTVKDLAFKSFKQDAVLFQDSNQEAYLIDKNGGEVRLGRLEQVNPKEIERLENYTIMDGTVYTTVKR